jgi:hypothetical protein
MAGLKKKKKDKSGSPNVILVVFLVLFVLTSIGLGVWGYYGYAEQKTLRDERKRALDTAKTEKTTAQYYSMQAADYLTAILGADSIDEVEKTELNGNRTSFNQADFGSFKLEKKKEGVKKIMDELRQKLGTAGNSVDYDKSFKAELEAAQAKIREMDGKTNAEVAKHEETKKLLAALTKKQEDAYAAIKAQITKDNLAQQSKTEEKSDEFKKLAEAVLALNAKIAADGEENSKKLDEYDKVVKAKERQIKILEAEKRENLALGVGPGGAPAGPATSRGELFPLMLDISPGKPLWDQPVGKVIRVDLDLRQVVINVGDAHGAKPELTFNVFGPNSAGRAEKQMKGTIEIIKVIDTNSSLCRITSLYDADGAEILMNLQTRGRILRETEAPMKEGDLLFNLFWGTRVAIAGYVSITGEKVDNPAQQFRQMNDFMALCRRNGMVVDAYVDMRDGQIKGKINAKTRYLIRGEDFARTDKKNGPPMKKDDDPDKDMPEKKEDGGVTDRIDQINRSNFLMRNEAKERGLLLISAENFANVIGYRKTRSANSVELSGFRPMLPVAGAPDGGVVRVPPEVRPKEKEEPKEKEMEKDKKDAGN